MKCQSDELKEQTNKQMNKQMNKEETKERGQTKILDKSGDFGTARNVERSSFSASDVGIGSVFDEQLNDLFESCSRGVMQRCFVDPFVSHSGRSDKPKNKGQRERKKEKEKETNLLRMFTEA